MDNTNLGGWALSEPDERGEFHCVPVNDLEEHLDDECKCCPVRNVDLPLVWMHNAFDKRELYETGEMKLS